MPEINSTTIFLIASFVIVIFLVTTKPKITFKEKYETDKSTSTMTTEPIVLTKPVEKPVAPKENSMLMKGASVSEPTIINPSANVQVNEMTAYPGPFEGCFPRQKELKPDELLPRDMHSKWAEVNPVGQGMLMDRNFLDAGHHVGINTVGQSLRNANYSLRSEIPNPQNKVSPWMQSTIDPDVGRKPLEIGAGY